MNFVQKKKERVKQVRRDLAAIALIWGIAAIHPDAVTDGDDEIANLVFASLQTDSTSEEIHAWCKQSVRDCVKALKVGK